MDILKKAKVIFVLLIFSNSAYSNSLSSEDIKQLSVVSTNKEFKNDVKLLYFWASWCPDCKSKLKGKIQEVEAKNSNVDFYLVNADREMERGKKFIQNENTQGSFYFDTDKNLMKKLKLFSIPSWALIKKQNNSYEVLKVQSGFDLDEVQSEINKQKGSL